LAVGKPRTLPAPPFSTRTRDHSGAGMRIAAGEEQETTLSWTAAEWIAQKRSALGMISGAVAGLVATTPAPGLSMRKVRFLSALRQASPVISARSGSRNGPAVTMRSMPVGAWGWRGAWRDLDRCFCQERAINPITATRCLSNSMSGRYFPLLRGCDLRNLEGNQCYESNSGLTRNAGMVEHRAAHLFLYVRRQCAYSIHRVGVFKSRTTIADVERAAGVGNGR